MSEKILPGYETTFITSPEITDEALKAINDRLGVAIAEFNGRVVLSENWGKRKLAYLIQKEQRGDYTYLAYTGMPGVVGEVERNLRLNDRVLRFLSVNLAEEFVEEAFMKKRAEMKEAAKKREEERQARREERAAERRAQHGDSDE